MATPEQIIVCKRRLLEAEEALHSLNTGTSARVIVDQNGERVEFTAINRQALVNYIAELRRCIDEDSNAIFKSAPMRFYL